MARGYPDFFGFSIFPYYGTLYREVIALTDLIDADEVSLTTISGKGILAAGNITMLESVAGAIPELRIYVDGELSAGSGRDAMITNGWFGANTQLMELISWTYPEGAAVASFPREIQFGQSFELRGRDQAGLGCKFGGNLYYYKIL